MPPKRKPRGAAAKKATEQQETEPESYLSEEYVARRDKLIADLEAQVQERLQHLVRLGDQALSALRQERYVQMIKLPKRVREMPLKVFREEYGGGMHNVLLEDINSRLQAAQEAKLPPATAPRGRRGRTPAPATVQRTTRKQAAAATQLAAETPAPAPAAPGFTPAAPGTLQRAPQLGEMFYSARGSPLGMFERDPSTQQGVLSTVLRGGQQLHSAVPAPSPAGANTLATIIKRPQPDGTSIEVDCDGGIKKLPKQQQAEVTAHLVAISKRIDSMLGRGGTVATRRR